MAFQIKAMVLVGCGRRLCDWCREIIGKLFETFSLLSFCFSDKNDMGMNQYVRYALF
jgi:hypothetical protein